MNVVELSNYGKDITSKDRILAIENKYTTPKQIKLGDIMDIINGNCGNTTAAPSYSKLIMEKIDSKKDSSGKINNANLCYDNGNEIRY